MYIIRGVKKLADYKKIKDFVFENDPQVRNRNIDQVLENIGLAINNPEAKAAVRAAFDALYPGPYAIKGGANDARKAI